MNNAQARRMVTLFALAALGLAAGSVVAGAVVAQERMSPDEKESRARLHLLGHAVGRYLLLNEGTLPTRISDLYRQGLILDVEALSSAASATRITDASQIDQETDFEVVGRLAAERPHLLVAEKWGFHNGQALAYFSDRTIRKISRPPKPALPSGAATTSAPITVGEGLKVARWLAFRPLTTFDTRETGELANAKMSADGKSVIYSNRKGVFVRKTDRAEKAVPLSTEFTYDLDISDGAEKVAWLENRNLRVKNGDGTGVATSVAPGVAVETFCMTAAGDRLVFMSTMGGDPQNHGIYSVPTEVPADGAPPPRPKLLINQAKMTAVCPKHNYFQNPGLDISADGAWIAFVFGMSAWIMNGDGEKLERLSSDNPDKTGHVFQVCVSPQGENVAYRIAYPRELPLASLTVVRRDGTGRPTEYQDRYMENNNDRGKAFHFTRDGRQVLAGKKGLRFYDVDTKGSSWDETLLGYVHWTNLGPANSLFQAPRFATLSKDGKRACFIGGNQLVLVERSPQALPSSIPLLRNVRISSREVAVRGAERPVVVTAEAVDAADAKVHYVGAWVLQRDDLTLGCQEPMADNGMAPDQKAKDGIYSVKFPLSELAKIEAGRPLTLRIIAVTDRGHALLVDVEGVRAK